MKHIHIYALVLALVFQTCCGQSQTNPPKDNIRSETKKVVASYGLTTSVRTIRQDINGNMWLFPPKILNLKKQQYPHLYFFYHPFLRRNNTILHV